MHAQDCTHGTVRLLSVPSGGDLHNRPSRFADSFETSSPAHRMSTPFEIESNVTRLPFPFTDASNRSTFLPPFPVRLFSSDPPPSDVYIAEIKSALTHVIFTMIRFAACNGVVDT
ncbi:hypothetical protein Trydic_g19638 [Trypoxylus dichotomus]